MRALDSGGSSALRFVLVMAVFNFFGDLTYEGGAAINGQFLGMLGASAAARSIIAGTGEFLGYALRQSPAGSPTGAAPTGRLPLPAMRSISAPCPQWHWPGVGSLRGP